MLNDIANQDGIWSSQSTYPSVTSNTDEFVDVSSVLDSNLTRIKNFCSMLNISPVKTTNFNKLNLEQRLEVVKRKADCISAAVVDELSSAVHQAPYVQINCSLVELTSEAADLSTLMTELKDKVRAPTKFAERIQLLTF